MPTTRTCMDGGGRSQAGRIERKKQQEVRQAGKDKRKRERSDIQAENEGPPETILVHFLSLRRRLGSPEVV